MDESNSKLQAGSNISRREFVGVAAIGGVVAVLPAAVQAQATGATVRTALTINGVRHDMEVDPRITVLDLLREDLKLTGTKKGCDHGQCGACTVLVNGERKNSCLMLAVMQNGKDITTVEGLAQNENLHPMQQAFIDHDGFQCGYCTPGQLCSAVALLKEIRDGAPSFVSSHLTAKVALTDEEIRERMSGNICRCGAYEGIVAAIRDVAGRASA
ncbi:MAG: 2Fe-2S iron-sulfur cluster binding domain-containing protein [Acidobacteriaceae bacterium]|nr:2Fe-2S iron-sulfur cluster binding domain-containing protein [Acidobacteriaceae bacterium]